MTLSADETTPIWAQLATHLFSRREALLTNWRILCEADASLGNVQIMSREEFNNLIPLLLAAFEQDLTNQTPGQSPRQLAKLHGLNRWQKAHDILRLIRELNHLTSTLLSEVQLFHRHNPGVDGALLLQAQQRLTQLMGEVVEGSLLEYNDLERLAAASRAGNLEKALGQLEAIAQQRSELLRTSAHDLKGSFGLIRSAVYVLSIEELSAPERTTFLAMLNRNLGSVQAMLEGLLDLSRLEAGEETLQLTQVDVGQLFGELMDGARPLAAQKGLLLQADGPASLLVTTDGVKLQRIVQNLLLNALKYSSGGIVSLCWLRESENRWHVSVQDAGPGLPDNLSRLLASQLRPQIELPAVTGLEQAQPPTFAIPLASPVASGPDLAGHVDSTESGEGVGLQIVKRLCDLLEGSMEIETSAGRGTLVRISLPMQHSQLRASTASYAASAEE